MPVYKIELDPETDEMLVAVALREWRPPQWQAEWMLLRAIQQASCEEPKAMDAETHIDGWAIVSQFGHTKLAGKVQTVVIGGSALLRVDIPAVEEHPAYTRFIGLGSIFDLTLVTEELARQAARVIRTEPVTVYIPRQLDQPERDRHSFADEDNPQDYDDDDLAR